MYGARPNDIIDGGAGIDTFVLEGRRDEFAVTLHAGTITVTGLVGQDSTDSLRNVERLSFDSGAFIPCETQDFPAEAVPPVPGRIPSHARHRRPCLPGRANASRPSLVVVGESVHQLTRIQDPVQRWALGRRAHHCSLCQRTASGTRCRTPAASPNDSARWSAMQSLRPACSCNSTKARKTRRRSSVRCRRVTN